MLQSTKNPFSHEVFNLVGSQGKLNILEKYGNLNKQDGWGGNVGITNMCGYGNICIY